MPIEAASLCKGQFCIFENVIIMLQLKEGEITFNIYRISCSEDYGYIKILEFGVITVFGHPTCFH